MRIESDEPHFREVIGALASGSVIKFTSDGHPELVHPGPRLGPTWDHLCRHGWLESLPNGGTFKLSDEGLKAYLHSTDEMQDGKLIDPHGFMP